MDSAKPNPWSVLSVLCVGTFATLLDTTIVNVSIPTMMTSLHATFDQIVWVVNAYLLVLAALLIPAGRLGNRYGQRTMWVAGLALFALASAACGAAQGPGELIAARAVQGIGAALLTPQALVIIFMTAPPQRLGSMLGVYTGMTGLAAVSGPTVGGLLVTYLDWRWVFYVNLPIALAGIVLAYRYVPDIRPQVRSGLDPIGLVLVVAGLLGIVYGMIEGQRYQWGEVGHGVTIPEVIVAGVVLLLGFVLWERRNHEDPMLPLQLFRNRTFAVMAWLTVIVQVALMSTLLVNGINLQSVLGMSAVEAGVLGLAMTIPLTVVSPFAGRLTDRFGGTYVLMTGFAVYAVGIAGVAVVASVHAHALSFVPPLFVGGVGMGLLFAPLSTLALRALPPQFTGAAAGTLSATRQVGAAMGSALTGAVLANRLASAFRDQAQHYAAALPPGYRQRFVDGFAGAAHSGLALGRGQTGGAGLPKGVPAGTAGTVRRLAHEVFTHGYVAAMRPTLGLVVALVLIGSACCLLLRNARPAAPAPAGPPPRQALPVTPAQPVPEAG